MRLGWRGRRRHGFELQREITLQRGAFAAAEEKLERAALLRLQREVLRQARPPERERVLEIEL